MRLKMSQEDDFDIDDLDLEDEDVIESE